MTGTTAEGHIAQAFDDDLEAINKLLQRMAATAAEQLSMATRAFDTGDLAAAKTVIDADAMVDGLEKEVHDLIVEVIARRQPMAVDLRELISSLQISTYLERIGDYAKNIARRTRTLDAPDTSGKVRKALVEMGMMAESLLRSVMEARLKRDPALALTVWEADAELDELHTEAHARILKFMRKNPDHLEDAAHILMIAKNFERIGDHCTNIAEEIHFHILGETPPDNRPKTDEVGN